MHTIKLYLHHYAPKFFRGGHICYFGAAALGAHEAYALIAGGLVVIAVVAYVLHIELE